MTKHKISSANRCEPVNIHALLGTVHADLCSGSFASNVSRVDAGPKPFGPSARLAMAFSLCFGGSDCTAVEPLLGVGVALSFAARVDAARAAQLEMAFSNMPAGDALKELRRTRAGAPAWQDLFKAHHAFIARLNSGSRQAV